MVLLAQSENERAGGGFFGLEAGAGMGGQEEGRLGVVAEVVTQDAESPRRAAKGPGDGLGRMPLDIKGAKGLVLPLFGQGRFEEEAVGLC
jgi:hypothetical protein